VIPVHYRIKLTHLIGIYDSYFEELFTLKDEYDILISTENPIQLSIFFSRHNI